MTYQERLYVITSYSIHYTKLYDVFRFTDQVNKNPDLDRAVESLLRHWAVRRPMAEDVEGVEEGERFEVGPEGQRVPPPEDVV